MGSFPLPSLPPPPPNHRSLCHYSPAYGGRPCSGPMFEYQICNSEDCPGPYEDFRAQQCAKRNSYYTHQDAKHSWLPYEPDSGEWPCSTQLLGMFSFLFSHLSRPKALGVSWGNLWAESLGGPVCHALVESLLLLRPPLVCMFIRQAAWRGGSLSRDAHGPSRSWGRVSAAQISVLSCVQKSSVL